MFNQTRYITAGVKAQIPEELQAALWRLIDQMNVPKQDYLQVFELSPVKVFNHSLQQVIHHQEEPAYQRTHRLSLVNPIQAKVYVIDDTTHATMLLADEY